jgi:hypothetical protein
MVRVLDHALSKIERTARAMQPCGGIERWILEHQYRQALEYIGSRLRLSVVGSSKAGEPGLLGHRVPGDVHRMVKLLTTYWRTKVLEFEQI